MAFRASFRKWQTRIRWTFAPLVHLNHRKERHLTHEIEWRFVQREILKQLNLRKTTNWRGLVSARSKNCNCYKVVVSFSNAATFHTTSCLITHKGCGLHRDWIKSDLRRPHAGRLCKLLLYSQDRLLSRSMWQDVETHCALHCWAQILDWLPHSSARKSDQALQRLVRQQVDIKMQLEELTRFITIAREGLAWPSSARDWDSTANKTLAASLS